MSDGVKVKGGVVITRNDVEKYKREILDQVVMVRMPEVASALGCSKSSAYSLVREGQLTGHTRDGDIKKGIRVLASELRDYVKTMRIDKNKWNE